MNLAKLAAVVVLAFAAVGPITGCAADSSADETEGTEDALTNADRQQIMDALRAKVRPELKNQDIVFDVSNGHLRSDATFAFLSGQPKLRATGRPVDYRGTEFQAYIDEGIFDDHVDALLKKENGKWKVVVHAIGSTDVSWVEWPTRFRAPASIFPGAQQESPAAADRRGVMDSLRAKLKPTVRNQDIVFVVANGGSYKTKNDWTFLRGQIRLRNGQPVDYRGTEYQQYIDEGLFDDGFGALLHKENGSWIVKDVAVGPTDVAWAGWDAQYGAPAEIFR